MAPPAVSAAAVAAAAIAAAGEAVARDGPETVTAETVTAEVAVAAGAASAAAVAAGAPCTCHPEMQSVHMASSLQILHLNSLRVLLALTLPELLAEAPQQAHSPCLACTMASSHAGQDSPSGPGWAASPTRTPRSPHCQLHISGVAGQPFPT